VMNPAPQDIFSQALQLLGQQPQAMQQQQQQPTYQVQQPPPQQQQQAQQIQANDFLQSLSAIFGATIPNAAFQPVPAATPQQQQPPQQQQQPQMQPFQTQQQQQQQPVQPQMQYSQQPQQQVPQPQPPQLAAAPMVPPSSIVIPSNAVPPPHPDLVAPLKRKRGRVSTFPQKLHQMLRDLEAEGKTNIASFVYEGRAFMIHDAKAFVEQCIPKYFKMTSLSSFQRQVRTSNHQRCGNLQRTRKLTCLRLSC
jgi:HSF-type DNA-binding